MTGDSVSAPASCYSDYSFYDPNHKPIWKRGISRRIGESAFVQQTLPTYRLSWSPLKICPCLLIIGALFTGLGIGIKKYAEGVEEVTINYTDCQSLEDVSKTCADVLNDSIKKLSDARFEDAVDIDNCTCRVPFQIDKPMNGIVHMHYALTNFFQNHLKYYQSRDDTQLKGNLFKDDGTPREPSTACEPYRMDKRKRFIYPCGLIANSMFTDVIDLYYHHIEDPGQGPTRQSSRKQVPLNRTEISWESDRMDKYINPPEFANESDPIWDHFVKPFGWKRTLWQLDIENATNNGVQNEDFIVWMRTAAFPWFRKLYRIIDDRVEPFRNGLPVGNYTLEIQYNYDVRSFEGQKSIVFSTTSMVAGKNMFLAIVYMGTGSFCIFCAIVLFVVYQFTKHKVNYAIKDD